jgi:ParB/RepB/Spo0J family partition protein
MTSGNFHSISLSSITVARETRQRRTIDDIGPLADSIRRLGLIHPIVITREHLLVAGERRTEACRYLGWDQIPAQYVDEVDPTTLHCIELEENIKRKDLSWQEHNDAIARYHELRAAEPGWTETKTAAALGLAQQTVNDHLIVKRERNNSRVAESATLRTAVRTAYAVAERRAADEFDAHVPSGGTYTPVLNTDFTVWAESYSGPKFNFIHCDFPYGIDAQDSGVNPAGYDDSLDTFLKLFKTLAVFLDNFCSLSAHMIFWYSPKHHFITWENLKLLDGFQFDEIPLVWHKADGRGIAPDQQRRPRRVYETAFFGWRGDRKIVKLKDNLFSAPTERQRHPHEKSELALRHFFELCVGPTTRLLDPTVGSGSSLRAAMACGAESVLGIELNEEYADAARRSLSGLGSGLGRDEDISDALAGQ